MLRKLLVLAAPLALVALLDLAFALGLWEPLAQPASHAGTSVRLKRMLRDPSLAHVDYVTLGSSRPEYGIDHAMLAAAAKESGSVHANLSMPGSHWMTIGILTRWLEREHPEVRGGVIALSVGDLAWPGNGSYELGIVQPFRRFADMPWIAAHVPFDHSDISTYGTYSALFEWRADIREFVRDPEARQKSIDWWRTNRSSPDRLFGNPESHGDMCAFGTGSLAACDAVDASTDPKQDGLKRQCRELRGFAAGRMDFNAMAQQDPLPDFMRETRDLVRQQLRATRWPQPPVVVLMPMPRIWTRQLLGDGQREWALSILQPLVAEGRIRLIDATGFFDDTDECGMFFDFYHQNAAGRERFTRWLLPQLDAMLYRTGAVAAPGIILATPSTHSP